MFIYVVYNNKDGMTSAKSTISKGTTAKSIAC